MALQTPGGLTGTPIIILQEGSTRNRGKQAQERNIQAARIIAQVVKATLGPQARALASYVIASAKTPPPPPKGGYGGMPPY